MNKQTFNDILYVSDGNIRRADIVVEGEYIAKITDKEELDNCFTLDYYFKNVDFIYDRCKIGK